MPPFKILNSPIDPGPTIIEASAGTGKTYTLSHLCARFLLDGTVSDPGEILLVTFTNDAAKELSERTRRVMELLADAPAPQEASKHPHIAALRGRFPDHRRTMASALERIDRLSVSTIHSFCTSVLQTEGALCGFPVVPETVSSIDDLIEEAVQDQWKGLISSDPVASFLAVLLGWKLEDDIRFFGDKLSLHAAIPQPPVNGFVAELALLCALPGRFDATLFQGLRTILGQVTSWNQGKSLADALQILDGLTAIADFTDPGFHKLLSELAGLPERVRNQGANQARRQAVSQDQAVLLAVQSLDQISRARWSFRIEALGAVHHSVERTLRRNRLIAYDGLIDAVAKALGQESPCREQLITRLRSRYQVALIDEAQDTDPKQYGIFRTVFLGTSNHRLVMVGDPKQAIYGFRGADLNTYLRARSEPGAVLYDLTETFRAPQPLVTSVNALFRRPFSFLNTGLVWADSTSGLDHDIRLIEGGRPDPARVEFWIDPNKEPYSTVDKRNALIAGQVASRIRSLMGRACIETTGGSAPESETVCAADFAILVSNGRQAVAMEEALRKLGIPAVRAAGDDVMASDEAADLLSILLALNDPRRKALRFTALSTRLMGRTDADLRRLADDGGDETELEKFRSWGDILEKSGPAVAITRIDHDERVSARLASGHDGDRRITNLRQLADLLQEAFQEHGGNVPGLLRWFAAAVSAAEDRSDVEERQIRLESDSEAVQIVTMHKAKGLEYRLVFCPFLWDFREPFLQEKYSDPNGSLFLADLDLIGKDSPTALAIRRAALEERIRLAYVAVTRAQVKVWIHAGPCGGDAERTALDWILRTEFCETEAPPTPESFPLWSPDPADHESGISALKESAGIVDDRILITTPPDPAAHHVPAVQTAAVPPLQEALPTPSVPSPWRLTSFSSLTREKNPHWSPVADEADAEEERPVGLRDEEGVDAHVPPANSFLLSPGSKLVGTVVHDWIETWDFGDLNETSLKHHLSGYSFPKPPEHEEGHPAVLTLEECLPGMLLELRDAVLPGLGIRVADACPEPSASEWQFHLPIAGKFGPARLAEIFAAHEQEGYGGYADALRRLNQDELEGYLHGFLDRIALKENGAGGRIWGVVDWKTNRLGDTPASYRVERLRACAMHSHYYLQTQLYLVALRRHLGKEAEISGAWLVFLRGVSACSDHGILHIPYDSGLITELDGLFSQPAN